MKKLPIIIIACLLSSCAYSPVDENTPIPNSVQQWSLTLKDSTNGYHQKDYKQRSYWFKKDSTSIKLVQKYCIDTADLRLDFLLILLIIGIICLCVIALT